MHLFSRQDYSATHKHSNQIDTSRKARVVLCHILLYGQSTQHKPRRGTILTSKARSTLAPINSSNTRHDKARDNYRYSNICKNKSNAHLRGLHVGPSQHIAFAKQAPSSQRLEALELSTTPFQRHSSSSYSEIQSATASSNGCMHV